MVLTDLQVPPVCVHAKSHKSCPTLWDPMDGNPPGSSVHGILQARTLEWVAMPSSRGSSRPRDGNCLSYVCLLHWQAGSLPVVPAGKPTGSPYGSFYSVLWPCALDLLHVFTWTKWYPGHHWWSGHIFSFMWQNCPLQINGNFKKVDKANNIYKVRFANKQ